MPGASRSRPGTSSLGRWRGSGRAGASAAMYRAGEQEARTTQNGTLTQNMNRQLRWVRIAPPTSGPRIGPSRAGSAT